MKPTLFEILEAWIRKWEELLKEPANLYLDDSFINILRPALVETQRAFTKAKPIERSANGWGRALLELLEQQFRQQSLEIDFFKLDYRKEIEELEVLLKQRTFDIVSIYPILEQIQHGPSVVSIFHQLAQEVVGTSDLNFDFFVTGSKLILRNLLGKFSISELKEKLQLSLARHGTPLAVTALLKSIREDNTLASRISSSWRSFIEECNSFDLTSVKSDSEGGLTGQFDLYSWNRKARHILSEAGRVVGEVLKRGRANINADQDRFRAMLSEQLGMVLWREYSLAYLQQLFEMPMGNARRDSEHIKQIGQELASILLGSSFKDKQFRHAQAYRPNPVDAVCADAFAQTIQNVARTRFANALELVLTPDVSTLIEALWTDNQFDSLDWESVSDETIDDSCLRWCSRLEVQLQLLETLSPFNVELHRRFKALLTQTNFTAPETWLNEEGFWKQWCENLSKMPSWNRGIFFYVPWESFSNASIEKLFDQVTRDFAPMADGWVVIFSIDNLKPPETPTNIANITFYDPLSFDYGERVSVLLERTETSTSARVKVVATTNLEAKHVATLRVRDILNCMALSLSVNRNWGGFKPVINNHIFARQQGTGNWSVDFPLIRNERPIIQSFANFERFGPTFDFLLSASQSASATLLQHKLLKALHWYAKARWEQDPAQSLLFYWIALEHLFEEGNDEKLLHLIAALHVNWRNVLSYGWYFLSRHQSDVLKQLRSDQDMIELLRQDCALTDWNKDYRVLLNYQNVITLVDLIPSEKKVLKDYVISYADYLSRFANDRDLILAEMERSRQRFRFRLLVIKHIRNEIVHQASGQVKSVHLYTSALEEIFEEAIVKLTNDAIKEVPECSSIKDLIEQYEEMWIS